MMDNSRVDPLLQQLVKMDGELSEPELVALEEAAFDFFQAGGVLDWGAWSQLSDASRHVCRRAYQRHTAWYIQALADAINQPDRERIDAMDEAMKDAEASRVLDEFVAASSSQQEASGP